MILRSMIFFILIFPSCYADVCDVQNITTLSQVYASQECLKGEIEKTIRISKDYEAFSEKLLKSLENFSVTKSHCSKYRYLEENFPNDSFYKMKKIEVCNLMKMAKSDLREAERRDNVISNHYDAFKMQIVNLRAEVELIEIKYELMVKNK